ncbi:hypothetical protein QQZ08_006395 [Neonectria magnoliae]|uniref:Uncharacterized protein n=1 Tax=Neonectria magnoliae TaxID=2732573 RepID=A0ABR1I2L0_9HYPO
MKPVPRPPTPSPENRGRARKLSPPSDQLMPHASDRGKYHHQKSKASSPKTLLKHGNGNEPSKPPLLELQAIHPPCGYIQCPPALAPVAPPLGPEHSCDAPLGYRRAFTAMFRAHPSYDV